MFIRNRIYEYVISFVQSSYIGENGTLFFWGFFVNVVDAPYPPAREQSKAILLRR